MRRVKKGFSSVKPLERAPSFKMDIQHAPVQAYTQPLVIFIKKTTFLNKFQYAYFAKQAFSEIWEKTPKLDHFSVPYFA